MDRPGGVGGAVYFKIKIRSFRKETFHIVACADTVGETIAPLIDEFEGSITNVEAGDIEKFSCELSTPMTALKELGYNCLTVWMSMTDKGSQNKQDETTKPNVFDILRKANKVYETYPEARVEKTAKDKLYNAVLDTLKTNNIGFTPLQVQKTGTRVLSSLTSVLWYMDGQHKKFASRAVELPSMFVKLCGFRNYAEQHKKIPEITSSELKDKIDDLSELLMIPWIQNKTTTKFRLAVEALVEGLRKYLKFLLDMTARTSKNAASPEPVRNLNDNWSLRVIEKSSDKTSEKFEKLVQKLTTLEMYAPLDLCSIEPSDKEERRYWLRSMALPFPVTLYTFSYGNKMGNLNIVWKIEADIRERSSNSHKEAHIIKAALDDTHVYKTRRMQRDFVQKYKQFTSPVVLRNMFHYLTNFEYTPQSVAESGIDLRLCQFLIENEDIDLMFDLRKNNGRPVTTEYEKFWSELEKFLDEKTAVHERRQSDVNYMPFAMSVEDLREQVRKELPAELRGNVPSVSWIKLNFYPGNPFLNSAANYTGRLRVKFQVQQRLLRAQHEDSEFGRNQFSLLKSFACKYRDMAVFQSLDDKAIVPIGEPSHAVSTGVRIHHGGLVTAAGQNVSLDHDFHIAGIVPSVLFDIDIPQEPRDSFYNGTVHITVKDKVFQASNPLRHATESVSIIREFTSDDDVNMTKPVLIRYTDGGPDHRVTYSSVQRSCLLEFIALDLDMMICARTAPAMSYLNPAERTMSLLNLALQNVALQRDKMPPQFEMQAKSKTMKGLRIVAAKSQQFKENYVTSTKGPITLIKGRFEKLKWKGDAVHVHEAATDDDMTGLASLVRIIDYDADVTKENVLKLKSPRLDEFLMKHCRRRHYIFQIKKCVRSECGYCQLNPPRMPADVFSELDFVPDPTDSDGFKSFDELYRTETTDAGRPSLTYKPQPTERDKQ